MNIGRKDRPVNGDLVVSAGRLIESCSSEAVMRHVRMEWGVFHAEEDAINIVDNIPKSRKPGLLDDKSGKLCWMCWYTDCE